MPSKAIPILLRPVAGRSLNDDVRRGGRRQFVALEFEAIERVGAGDIERALVEAHAGAAFGGAEMVGLDRLVILVELDGDHAGGAGIVLRLAGGDIDVAIAAHGDMAGAGAQAIGHDGGVKARRQHQPGGFARQRGRGGNRQKQGGGKHFHMILPRFRRFRPAGRGKD